jgi:hypothetical protein
MGKIANYKTGECYLCGQKFKGKGGLRYHFKNSKRHWELKKGIKDKPRPTLPQYFTINMTVVHNG